MNNTQNLEILKRLTNSKIWTEELREVRHYNGYSYASNSMYIIRYETGMQGEETKLIKNMEKHYEHFKPENTVNVSIDIFKDIDSIDTTWECGTCN